MQKTVIAIVISFAAAFAAASWMYTAEEKPKTAVTTTGFPSSFDTGLPVEDRIAALERAVSDEQFARQLLQEEVFYLTSELEEFSNTRPFSPNEEVASATAEEAESESRSSRRESWRRRNSIEGKMEALIEAGFLPSQASMIVQRESELQMESIKARYEAEKSGDSSEYWRNRTSSSATIRQELGDADYERYLTANGRSTNVAVSSVIESSPAQSAGLQAGDEIVRYAGERVFSMTDLTRETMNGTAGQTVVVDIMRNGNPMQIVMPRGPVGISGGRRSR